MYIDLTQGFKVDFQACYWRRMNRTIRKMDNNEHIARFSHIRLPFEYYSEGISLLTRFGLSKRWKLEKCRIYVFITIVLFCMPGMTLSQDSTAENCTLTCPNSRSIACLPQSSPLSITLGVTDREVCHTNIDCYGSTSNEPDRVQQRPVNLIFGQLLIMRIDPMNVIAPSDYWQFYRVSSGQFFSCSSFIADGTLVSNVTQNSTFVFNSSLYGLGRHFLAGNINNLLSCRLGFRISITVQNQNCGVAVAGDSPCSGRGICVTTQNSSAAQCSCCNGFNGTICNEYDACISNPCLNSGNCTDISGGFSTNFSCKCTPYYTGKTCETQIDYCSPMPCLNNATCSNLFLQRNYSCICLPGFTGGNCGININDCIGNNCTENATCIDQVNGYRCECIGNWTGEFCNQDINECNTVNCLNNATCTNTPGSFYCTCPVNVTGRLCETDLYDNCLSHPCMNGGTCTDLIGTFACTCPQGYTGERCETDINECLNNPCTVEGTSRCINGPGNYTCVCLSEYTGRRCEKFLDRCASAPCLNGGLCVNLYGRYSCVCPAGYRGSNCQDVLNKCSYIPCKNNGTCERTGDFLSNYTCHCASGWTGRNCTQDFNECQSDPCLNNATCQNLFNKYACVCAIGWNGTQCETNVNACETLPCRNNATCTDLQTGLDYLCTCAPGFTGQNCSVNIDDCVRLNANCNNGRCVDQVGSYYCNCSEGWFGKHCDTNRNICASRPCLNGATCENVNTTSGFACNCRRGWTGENCATNIDDCISNLCQNGATCNDFLGHYNCTCRRGYSGQYCETEINECLSQPCRNNATCVNNIGNFSCNCLQGYTGAQCETDINECASFPCFNNATCVDEVNRYTCRCHGGYVGVHCEIPLCRTNPCRNDARCVQSQDRYICVCLPGFTGRNCEAQINECSSTPCQNNATCVDLLNGYQCSCVNGYTGRLCETHLCETNVCQNGAPCLRMPSGYVCSCLNGYTGQNCEVQINECLSNPCNATGSLNCTDVVAGYRCYCKGGYVGQRCDNHTCDAIKPCQNGATCIKLPNGYQCTCLPGFTGVNCEDEINECASDPCINGTCTDRVNGYSCNCSSMYTGARCETNMNLCASRPCMNNATCENNITSLSFSCRCQGGYTGNLCQNHLCDTMQPCLNNGTCLRLPLNYSCLCEAGFTGRQCEIDINECSSSPCLNSGTCENGRGFYACSCPRNFTGNRCETLLDYCSPNPCNNGTCANNYTLQTFSCSCPPAFSGRQCELHICDVRNPCQNGAACIRDISNARCICLPGYTGRNCSININECRSSPCINNGSCIDGVDGYTCQCPLQYTGRRCDVQTDYCASNPCGNSSTCINDYVSTTYKCNCHPYRTGRNCEVYLGPCYARPCLNNGTCVETLAQSYRCVCPFGFSGSKCESLTCPCQNNGRCALFNGNIRCVCPNEYGGVLCDNFYGDCRNNASRKCIDSSFCVQGPYGYFCQCPGHLSGDSRCTKLSTCNPSPCLNGAGCSANGVFSLTCTCPPGYTGQFCQFDINECAPNPCLNGGTCLEVGAANSTCFCPSGFFGDRCQNETASTIISQSFISRRPLPSTIFTYSTQPVVYTTPLFQTPSIAHSDVGTLLSTPNTLSFSSTQLSSLTFAISSSVALALSPSASSFTQPTMSLPVQISTSPQVTSIMQSISDHISFVSSPLGTSLSTFAPTIKSQSSVEASPIFSTLATSTTIFSSQIATFHSPITTYSSPTYKSSAQSTIISQLSFESSAVFSSPSKGSVNAEPSIYSSSLNTVATHHSFILSPTSATSVFSTSFMFNVSSIVQPSSVLSFQPTSVQLTFAVSSLSFQPSTTESSAIETSPSSLFSSPSSPFFLSSSSSYSSFYSSLSSTLIPSTPSSYLSSSLISTTTHLSSVLPSLSSQLSRNQSSAVLTSRFNPISTTSVSSASSSLYPSSSLIPSLPHLSSSYFPPIPSSVTNPSDIATSHSSYLLSFTSQAPTFHSTDRLATSFANASSPSIHSSLANSFSFQSSVYNSALTQSPPYQTSFLYSSQALSVPQFSSFFDSVGRSSSLSSQILSSSITSPDLFSPTGSYSISTVQSAFITASSSLQYSFNISTIPRQTSVLPVESPLPSLFNATSIPLQSSFKTASSSFQSSVSISTIPIQISASSVESPLQLLFNSSSTLLQSSFNIAKSPFQPSPSEATPTLTSLNSTESPVQSLFSSMSTPLQPLFSSIASSIQSAQSSFISQQSTSSFPLDPCTPNPCLRGGNCTRLSAERFNCSCDIGYGGERCNDLVCQCQNNGRCVRDSPSLSYRCVCQVGFSGKYCEDQIGDCRTQNCSGNGICRERLQGFVCVCNRGYYGENCGNYTNTCQPNPCQHSGICLTRPNSSVSTFTCVCPQGYQGQLCQFDYNECASAPCLNGGTCRENQINSYECYCPSWSYGANCELLRSSSALYMTSRRIFLSTSLLSAFDSRSTFADVTYFSTRVTSRFSLATTPSNISEATAFFSSHTLPQDFSRFASSQPYPTSSVETPTRLNSLQLSASFSQSNFEAMTSIWSSKYPTSILHPAISSVFGSVELSERSSFVNSITQYLHELSSSSLLLPPSSPLLSESAFTLAPSTDSTLSISLDPSGPTIATSSVSESFFSISTPYFVASTFKIQPNLSKAVSFRFTTESRSVFSPSPTESSLLASLSSSAVPTSIPVRNLTCDDEPCNGYPCYNESHNALKFRCVCYQPSFGPRCIQGITIHFPYFNGHSYVEYASIPFNNIINTIVLTFRTTSSSGLLLYAGHQTFRDFILLRIVNGLVEFRFNAGAETISIIAAEKVDTGMPMMIVATHDSRSGTATLSINSSTPISRSSSSSSFTSLQLSTSWFIGGLNDSFRPVNISNGLPVLASLVGCIRDLQVNAVPYRVLNAKSWLSISECDVPACQRGPCRNNATCLQNQANPQDYTCRCGTGYYGQDCTEREAHCQGDPCNGGTCAWTPTGYRCLCQYGRHGPSCLSSINITRPIFSTFDNYSSYIEYPWQQTVRQADSRFEIKMQFKLDLQNPQSTRNGLLVFTGQSTIGASGDDFFALGIINNYTYLIYNLGGGLASLRSSLKIDHTRAWHFISAGRNGRSGFMHLDNHPAVYTTSPGILTGLDVYSPLYIGGVPDFSKLPPIVRSYFSSGYVGTIFDVSFRANSSDFNSLLTFQIGSVPGGVTGVAVQRGLNVGDSNIDECLPNPCQNNGTCSQNGGQFICSCQTGWTGITCRDSRIPCIDYNPCFAGSVCQSNTNGISCDCQLGRIGIYCDQTVNVTQPFFKANSFLGFKMPDVTYYTKVYIRFKAAKLDGLLVYLSEKTDSSSGDFFAISLWQGFVYVRFNLGLGVAVMSTRNKITLKKWHELYVERRTKEAIMRLDSFSYIGVRSSGSYSQLNVGSVLYLGGLPRLSALHPSAVKDASSQRDFEGAVSHFVVNDIVEVYNPVRAIVGRNIEDATRTCVLNDCQNGAICTIATTTSNYPYTCSCNLGWEGRLCNSATPRYSRARFNGDGFIFYQDNNTAPVSENHIELSFNTSNDGLLFWLGDLKRSNSEYLAIGIKNSKLTFSINTGGGVFRAQVNQNISDGVDRRAIISRIRETIFLTVSGLAPVLQSFLSSDYFLDYSGHIYIGGFDGNITSNVRNEYSVGLNGCIWNVKVRATSEYLDLNKNSFNRGVNVRSCD